MSIIELGLFLNNFINVILLFTVFFSFNVQDSEHGGKLDKCMIHCPLLLG